MFLNFFSKTEAGHVLKMFLQFWLISASRSYKLGSYKKKTCTINESIEIFMNSKPILEKKFKIYTFMMIFLQLASKTVC